MSGSINLQLNNAGFNNNGNVETDVSTVKFSGNADTTTTYIKGTAASTFYNLTVSKSAFGLAMKSYTGVKNVLKLSAGQIYADSNLTLLSSSDLTARVDVVPAGSDIYGKAHVQRYIPGKRAWRLMTAPVTSSSTIFNSWQNKGVYEAGRGTWVTGPNPNINNGLDASPQNNVSMKGFSYQTQQFTNVLNTFVPISSGTSGTADNIGYFIFVRGDRVYNNFNFAENISSNTTLTSIGKLQTGSQTFTCSPDSGKYTFIGNPYASPLDFNLITRNNIVKRFFVWDSKIGVLGSWVMQDDLDNNNAYTKSIDESELTCDMQSSQAFFVQTLANSAASITIDENDKSAQYIKYAFRPSDVPPVEQSGILRTKLYAVSNNNSLLLTDATFAEFKNGFSDIVDLDDAGKFVNLNENISLFRQNRNLTAERRPPLTVKDTLYYRVWKTTVGSKYMLEFIGKNMVRYGLEGILIDKYLNTQTPISLLDTTRIYFSINNPASADIDRFKLVFRPFGGVLPLQFIQLQATAHQQKITLQWDVENEVNVKRYNIERSYDGENFENIGSIPAASLHHYSWEDQQLSNMSPLLYYRIKAVDNDGKVKYSSITTISPDNNIRKIAIFPNPVVDQKIVLRVNNIDEGKYQLQLYNIAGEKIFSRDINHKGLNMTYTIDIQKHVPKGMYVVKVISAADIIFSENVLID